MEWAEAIQTAAEKLSQIAATAGPAAVACLGSARSSLETQATLQRFCRALGWSEPRYFSVPSQERQVKAAVARLEAPLAVSLREIETADFVLVVGADPVNEAPMLALALRQAWLKGGKVAVLDPRPVFLPFDFEHLPLAPGDLEVAMGGLAAAANGTDILASGSLWPSLPQIGALGRRLTQTQRPVIVCGTGIVRESTPGLAADLALRLREGGLNAGLFYLLPGANAFGAALLSADGEAQAPLIEELESGAIKALMVVENDPFWDYPDRGRLVRALDKLELLVALDYLPSPTVQRADIVFPTLTLFERNHSSFVNQEGRLQLAPPVHLGGMPMAQISPEKHPPRTFLSHIPGGEPRTPAEILQELATAMPRVVAAPGDDLWDWLSRENPVFANITDLFEPPSGARLLPPAIPARTFSPAAAPVPAERFPDHLELLLVDLTFGTEELASYSKHIQPAEEPPRLRMHPEDAAKLGLKAGDRVALRLPGGALEVDLQVAENMASGVLILPRHRQLNWRLAPDYRVMVSSRDIVKVEA